MQNSLIKQNKMKLNLIKPFETFAKESINEVLTNNEPIKNHTAQTTDLNQKSAQTISPNENQTAIINQEMKKNVNPIFSVSQGLQTLSVKVQHDENTNKLLYIQGCRAKSQHQQTQNKYCQTSLFRQQMQSKAQRKNEKIRKQNIQFKDFSDFNHKQFCFKLYQNYKQFLKTSKSKQLKPIQLKLQNLSMNSQVSTQVFSYSQLLTLSREIIKQMIESQESSISKLKALISQDMLSLHIEQLKYFYEYQIKYNKESESHLNKTFQTLYLKKQEFLKQLLNDEKIKHKRSSNGGGNLKLKNFNQFDLSHKLQFDMLINCYVLFQSQNQICIQNNIKSFVNKIIDQIKQNYKYFENSMEIIDRRFTQNNPYFQMNRKIKENSQKYTRANINEFQLQSLQVARVIFKLLQKFQEMFQKPYANILNSQRKYVFYRDQQTSTKKQFFVEDDLNKNDSIRKYLSQEFQRRKQKILKQKSLRSQKLVQFNKKIIQIMFTSVNKRNSREEQDTFKALYVHLIHKFISQIAVKQLVQYIKQLIQMGKKFSKQHNLQSTLYLIKFQIFDLMRCQVFTDKVTIQGLYDKFKTQDLKKQNLKQFTIIKTKNRFETMNDLMIFYKMKHSFIICQCQLILIDECKQDDNIKLKQKTINHFLYQLLRSSFGPISQLSAIYKKQYASYLSACLQYKLSTNQSFKHSLKQCKKYHSKEYNEQIMNQIKLQQIKEQTQPFICDACRNYQPSHSNFLTVFKCQKCDKNICNHCMDLQFKITTDMLEIYILKQFQSNELFSKDHLKKVLNYLFKELNIEIRNKSNSIKLNHSKSLNSQLSKKTSLQNSLNILSSINRISNIQNPETQREHKTNSSLSNTQSYMSLLSPTKVLMNIFRFQSKIIEQAFQFRLLKQFMGINQGKNKIKCKEILDKMRKIYGYEYNKKKCLLKQKFFIVSLIRNQFIFKCFRCDFYKGAIINPYNQLQIYTQNQSIQINNEDILLYFNEKLFQDGFNKQIACFNIKKSPLSTFQQNKLSEINKMRLEHQSISLFSSQVNIIDKTNTTQQKQIKSESDNQRNWQYYVWRLKNDINYNNKHLQNNPYKFIQNSLFIFQDKNKQKILNKIKNIKLQQKSKYCLSYLYSEKYKIIFFIDLEYVEDAMQEGFLKKFIQNKKGSIQQRSIQYQNWSIKDSQIKCIQNIIWRNQIQFIYLKNNKIQNYQSLLRSCPNIKKLNLSNNFIKQFIIDYNINQLKSLEQIDVSVNLITNLQIKITNKKKPFLENLKIVNFKRNKIKDIKSFFCIILLKKLQFIELSFNQISEVPRIMATKLRIVKFKDNSISELKEFFSHQYSDLIEINFRGNLISFLPKCASQNIRTVDLRGNKISNLQNFAEGEYFQKLTHLYISHIAIQNLPMLGTYLIDFAYQDSNLTNRQIIFLLQFKCQRDQNNRVLPRLKRINLSKNELIMKPDLRVLQSLQIDRNSFSSNPLSNQNQLFNQQKFKLQKRQIWNLEQDKIQKIINKKGLEQIQQQSLNSEYQLYQLSFSQLNSIIKDSQLNKQQSYQLNNSGLNTKKNHQINCSINLMNNKHGKWKKQNNQISQLPQNNNNNNNCKNQKKFNLFQTIGGYIQQQTQRQKPEIIQNLNKQVPKQFSLHSGFSREAKPQTKQEIVEKQNKSSYYQINMIPCYEYLEQIYEECISDMQDSQNISELKQSDMIYYKTSDSILLNSQQLIKKFYSFYREFEKQTITQQEHSKQLSFIQGQQQLLQETSFQSQSNQKRQILNNFPRNNDDIIKRQAGMFVKNKDKNKQFNKDKALLTTRCDMRGTVKSVKDKTSTLKRFTISFFKYPLLRLDMIHFLRFDWSTIIYLNLSSSQIVTTDWKTMVNKSVIFKHLKDLNLSQNSIQVIEQTQIYAFTSLQNLNVKDNPLTLQTIQMLIKKLDQEELNLEFDK